MFSFIRIISVINSIKTGTGTGIQTDIDSHIDTQHHAQALHLSLYIRIIKFLLLNYQQIVPIHS